MTDAATPSMDSSISNSAQGAREAPPRITAPCASTSQSLQGPPGRIVFDESHSHVGHRLTGPAANSGYQFSHTYRHDSNISSSDPQTAAPLRRTFQRVQNLV